VRELLVNTGAQFPARPEEIAAVRAAAAARGIPVREISVPRGTPQGDVERAVAAQPAARAELPEAADRLPQPPLSPEETAVEERARANVRQNAPALAEAYHKKFGNEISTDNAREIVSPEYAAGWPNEVERRDLAAGVGAGRVSVPGGARASRSEQAAGSGNDGRGIGSRKDILPAGAP